MSTTKMTNPPHSILKSMNLVYFAMVAMLLVFAIVVLILNSTGIVRLAGPQDTLQLRYLVFAITPLGLFAGYFIFKRLVSAIPSTLTLSQKLLKYQQAILIRSVCFEFPGLVAGVAAILSKDNSFLLFTALIAVLYLLFRPTINSITIDLNLSQPERNQLENPKKPS